MKIWFGRPPLPSTAYFPALHLARFARRYFTPLPEECPAQTQRYLSHASLLQVRKPPADRVERCYNKYPNQPDPRQAEPPSRRRSERKMPEAWRFEHPIHMMIADVANDDREQMNEWDVQHIIRERHAAKDERRPEPLRASGIERPEGNHRGTESH